MLGVTYLIPFLLYFANSATALQCYECDSSKNVACDIGLLSFTQSVKDCSAEGGFLGSFVPKECTKIVVKAKDGSEYIRRGCGVNTGIFNNCRAIAKALQFAVDDDQIRDIDCYTCDSDKCNSAMGLQAFTLLGVITACLLYLF